MVFGITRVRDEDDIVEFSLRRMVRQVDHVLVGEGGSSDATREIIERLAVDFPITAIDDSLPSVDQRYVMSEYARRARELGASWVVPFDMDEIWTAAEGTISETLGALPEYVLLAPARLLNHCCTSEDPDDPDPFVRMGWRDVEMLPLPKVACRTVPGLAIDHGNHGAHFDDVRHPPAVNGLLQARHYPYRSPEQFIKRVKIAWPQLRDSGLPETHGAHMWAYGRHLDEFGEEGLRRWFADGMLFEDPERHPDLVFDPCLIAPAVPVSA